MKTPVIIAGNLKTGLQRRTDIQAEERPHGHNDNQWDQINKRLHRGYSKPVLIFAIKIITCEGEKKKNAGQHPVGNIFFAGFSIATY